MSLTIDGVDPGWRALVRDPARAAAAAGIVVVFVIAVIALTTISLSFAGWFSVASAVAAMAISIGLISRHAETRRSVWTSWPGIAACAGAAAACVVSIAAETPTELTVVAALLAVTGWCVWASALDSADIRYRIASVGALVIGLGVATAVTILAGWTNTLNSDATGVLIAFAAILAAVILLARSLASQVAALVGLAMACAVIFDAASLNGWTCGSMALTATIAVAAMHLPAITQQEIGRLDPWIGALAALALFVAGLFSLDDPVRSLAFSGSIALFAGALFASMLQTRDRETRVIQLLDINASMQDLARVDFLTGLPNREALEIRLAEEVERAVRYRQPLAICFLDIDHFKTVNDTLGHQAGDVLLQQLAGAIRTTIRTPDFAARYGGEEFVIIAPGTWTADALTLGQRIQRAIAQDVETEPGNPVTVSIGIAGIPEHGTDAAEIIARADQALYVAKANGRNRIEISSEP